jgi:hypothetical protein
VQVIIHSCNWVGFGVCSAWTIRWCPTLQAQTRVRCDVNFDDPVNSSEVMSYTETDRRVGVHGRVGLPYTSTGKIFPEKLLEGLHQATSYTGVANPISS